MDPEIQRQLDEIKQSNAFEQEQAASLAREANKIKKTNPLQALVIFRVMASAMDNYRWPTNREKLEAFSKCSQLGSQLGNHQWSFDMRAADLSCQENNHAMAGLCYEHAATSLKEQVNSGTAAEPDAWVRQTCAGLVATGR